MDEIIKPDYKIFASEAKANETPSYPDVNRGWGISLEQTEGLIPLEWLNGAFNRVDKNILSLYQQGIPEWSRDCLYAKDAITKYRGKLYRATQETKDAVPRNSSFEDNGPSPWEELIPSASESQEGVVRITSDEYMAYPDVAVSSSLFNTLYRKFEVLQNRADELEKKLQEKIKETEAMVPWGFHPDTECFTDDNRNSIYLLRNLKSKVWHKNTTNNIWIIRTHGVPRSHGFYVNSKTIDNKTGEIIRKDLDEYYRVSTIIEGYFAGRPSTEDFTSSIILPGMYIRREATPPGNQWSYCLLMTYQDYIDLNNNKFLQS